MEIISSLLDLVSFYQNQTWSYVACENMAEHFALNCPGGFCKVHYHLVLFFSTLECQDSVLSVKTL